jgi:prepilin-type N-terminal cleavage/methylation domain-containing protein
MSLEKKLNKQSGFTIIEVVLVLAIAGLIFLIVFLALPQLQRSRRDTQRRNDASRVLAAMENFSTNNGGSTATNSDLAPILAGYLNVGGVTFEDPNKVPYALIAGTTPTLTTTGANMAVDIGGSACATGVTGTARTIAVRVQLEEGVFCQDNQ